MFLITLTTSLIFLHCREKHVIVPNIFGRGQVTAAHDLVCPLDLLVSEPNSSQSTYYGIVATFGLDIYDIHIIIQLILYCYFLTGLSSG